MRRRELALRLVSSSSGTERRKLISDNKKLADEQLAGEIREICYARWTAEPLIAKRAAAALKELSLTANTLYVRATWLWVNGIALIAQSRFERAVERLDESAKIFRSIGRPLDASQTQVAKLIALGVLGRYAEADRVGRAALKVFVRAGDQLAAGKIEMNLSNVAARRERHKDAEAFALSALRRFRRIGERAWQTMAENDLASTYSEINDFRRAEKYFTLAAESARRTKMLLTEAEIEASIGNLELFRGRYAEALRSLERSREKYERLSMPHQSAIAELEIADAYAELGLNVEAVSMLEPAAEKLKRLRLTADEARARSVLARLFITQNDLSRASKELKRARILYKRESNPAGIARSDLLTAEIEIALGRFESALSLAGDAITSLTDTANKRSLLYARWLAAESQRLDGRTKHLRQTFEQIADDAKSEHQLNVAVAALTSMGKLAVEANDIRGARGSLSKAISLVEVMRAPLAAEEFRMSFLSGRLEPYNELVKLEIAQGRFTDAFIVHESARARSLAEGVGNKASAAGKTDRELERLREELNWLYSRVSHGGGSAATEKEITALEKKISDKMRRIAALAKSSKADLRKIDVEQLVQTLGDERALVEYVGIDGRLSAFVVSDGNVDYLPDLCSEDEIRSLLDGLRFQFGTFRFGQIAVAGFLDQLKRSTDHYLYQLFQKLIAPIQQLTGSKRLIVAPSGQLNYVPFSGLFDGEKYLAEISEITVTPSAAVWLSLSKRRRPRSDTALVMAFSDESIPLADAEALTIGSTFKDPTILTGKKASFTAFVENAPKADVIHLACHGQFRSDAPMFSSLHLADGWVTVSDIAHRKLKASLVTLSACETGLSRIHDGEEMLGLTRGFLSSGARSLVVSLWTVNDQATSRLMADLYRRLQRGDGPAASLRAAQTDLIRSGAHPYFWSAFVCIGA